MEGLIQNYIIISTDVKISTNFIFNITKQHSNLLRTYNYFIKFNINYSPSQEPLLGGNLITRFMLYTSFIK